MIKYLQKLNRKKGFTMVELIVVIAILAIMMLVILLNIDNKSSRIKSANSAASDFYAAVQSAFTRYMVYPAPLSPTFRDNPNTTPFMKYYKGANGNYPYDVAENTHPTPITNDNYPSPATLNIEVKVKDNKIEYVNCGMGTLYQPGGLLDKTTDDGSEFGRLLKLELEKRVEYQDGYYYASISSTPQYDSAKKIKKLDTVVVDYAAFSFDKLKNDSSADYTFSGRDNVLQNGDVCGTAAPSRDKSGNSIARIGTDGTKL